MASDAGSRPVSAIILAGGGPDPRLAPGLPNKTFLPVGGRALALRVTDALRASPAVERIVAIGPAELASLLGDSVEIISGGKTLIDNMLTVLWRLDGGGQILAVAADLPLLTSKALDQFLEQCDGNAGFYYPLISRAAMQTRFPRAKKTYARLASGAFCGGGLALFNNRVNDQLRRVFERALALRKRPWALWAQLLGPFLLVKLAARTLTIAEVEARMRSVTGIQGKGVVLDAPELALDVDDETDLTVALSALQTAGA